MTDDTLTTEAERLAAKLERTPLYEGHGEGSDLPEEAIRLLRALSARAAPSPATGAWRNMASAPCDDTNALVWWDDVGRISVEDLDHDSDPAWWRERGATHWMPLPAPPDASLVPAPPAEPQPSRVTQKRVNDLLAAFDSWDSDSGTQKRLLKAEVEDILRDALAELRPAPPAEPQASVAEAARALLADLEGPKKPTDSPWAVAFVAGMIAGADQIPDDTPTEAAVRTVRAALAALATAQPEERGDE